MINEWHVVDEPFDPAHGPMIWFIGPIDHLLIDDYAAA